ncbi:MAG: rRNA maturation RNase YbeY [Candidatus Omnitrophica bacterium]|nr:rRNA maturation RNase YbeY [Candidatus Omnitrophota bacterium]
MIVRVMNHQRLDPVPLAWLTRVSRQAAACLRMSETGQLQVAFVSPEAMRQLNRRFLRHTGLTDVLSFRYTDGLAPRAGRERILGEVLIAPRAAKRYAAQHGIAYRAELARYVVHGLLHWLGHDDKTAAQQRRMRAMENRVLTQCEVTDGGGKGQETRGRGTSRAPRPVPHTPH